MLFPNKLFSGRKGIIMLGTQILISVHRAWTIIELIGTKTPSPYYEYVHNMKHMPRAWQCLHHGKFLPKGSFFYPYYLCQFYKVNRLYSKVLSFVHRAPLQIYFGLCKGQLVFDIHGKSLTAFVLKFSSIKTRRTVRPLIGFRQILLLYRKLWLQKNSAGVKICYHWKSDNRTQNKISWYTELATLLLIKLWSNHELDQLTMFLWKYQLLTLLIYWISNLKELRMKKRSIILFSSLREWK